MIESCTGLNSKLTLIIVVLLMLDLCWVCFYRLDNSVTPARMTSFCNLLLLIFLKF